MSGTKERYPDIYFEPEYAALYEDEQNKAVEYVYSDENGTVTNLFMKRKINIETGDGAPYYDIITPYGYGGPVIISLRDPDRKKELLSAYLKDFSVYTKRNRIVSEFVRFHPIIGNGLDFQEFYQSKYDRHTTGTTLTYDDVILAEFSKHKRKDIRKILQNPEIRYAIDEKPDNLDDFLEVYYSTMDRDAADAYYYFDRKYFEQLLAGFPDNVITGKVFLQDKLIAMGVYFRYGRFLHAHLSGTLSEYLHYSPAYILKYALALYGHDNGYQVIHYGGGTSPDPENGLYKFKKNFGKNTEFDFYIAKKIWNPEVYSELCRIKGADESDSFFPAYRAGRK